MLDDFDAYEDTRLEDAAGLPGHGCMRSISSQDRESVVAEIVRMSARVPFGSL